MANRQFSEFELNQSLQLFQVLSNEKRLKILLSLLNQEYNVSELAIEVGASQSVISHQLSLLKKYRLVKIRHEGRKHYYRIIDEHIKKFLLLTLSHLKE